MKKLNILSSFDGKSSGFTACELAGVEVGTYYSAEIDKYAIKVSDSIHPNQTRLGSVTEWLNWDIDWSSIDMIFGGFPCQAWSMAGKQLGDKDERGMLFWTMLDIMKHVRHHNPKADFLIENVKMKKEFEEYITDSMTSELNLAYFEYEDVMPTGEMEHIQDKGRGLMFKTLINSALVSAQNRNRYYWTSFPVTQPEDRGIVLADIIEGNGDVCGAFRGRYIVGGKRGDHLVSSMAGKTEQRLEIRKDNKTNALTTVQKDNQVVSFKDKSRTVRASGRNSPPDSRQNWDNALDSKVNYRKLTPRECFRLQTVPAHYIDKILDCGVSNTQLYKIAGNGWTDEVIAHILRCR